MGKDKDALMEEKDRILVAGRPAEFRPDNKVLTARYTVLTFIPVAVMEQFRRFANLYFLCVGCIMAVGWYTSAYESAINPWTTLGPLSIVISFSLLVEGAADSKRHRNDDETNNAPCVIMRRTDEFEEDENSERDENLAGGRDVVVNLTKAYYMGGKGNNVPETPRPKSSNETARICFQKVRRMDIRQGHFIVVKNREMVPADMLLVASSAENGSSYIETSSIDGETNLKLRTSPHLPAKILKHLRDGLPMEKMDPISEEDKQDDPPGGIETLEQATKRVARFSSLCFPKGVCALRNPDYKGVTDIDAEGPDGEDGGLMNVFKKSDSKAAEEYTDKEVTIGADTKYVAALTSEPPNPHVNTFSGKLTMPPFEEGGACIDIPLGAENILLRGAVVRNTEWVIGLVVFTGTDTKLVRNSFETPSKFSQLDRLMNQTVVLILCLMFCIISYLSTQAVITTKAKFDDLWYVGYNNNVTQPWPYLPDLEVPQWDSTQYNWAQMFLLFITLLNNAVPLSLYVTIELVTFFMLWFVYADLEMYCDQTNTRAVARSTIVTDLGRIQYIFSDKTGTLTQNVMRFKRCSVDGIMFGAPIAKSRPGAEQDDHPSEFHPLKRLLVGNVSLPKPSGLQGLGGEESGEFEIQADNKLTLNAEMFLRVLSLCHTVVVEKDLDMTAVARKSESVNKSNSSWMKGLFGSSSTSKKKSNEDSIDESEKPAEKSETAPAANTDPNAQGPDGAPYGFAYQAESPDEGALVSAASSTFGFQVVTRDSSGIKLRVNSPSILRDQEVVEALKNGSKTLLSLAAESASAVSYSDGGGGAAHEPVDAHTEETWEILAVNKFDSDRKRMSILLRAPKELGSLPILFCKGADSAMLDPAVCTGLHAEDDNTKIAERAYGRASIAGKEAEEQWELSQTLGLQAHLGDFATEGLRTLVLGMRILTEEECEKWLEQFRAAATSLKDRDGMLTAAAKAIESQLYVVGATAIEDKLQVGVPQTIATLEKAGIKLWVLTGDKRETAIEIGYSTHVLTNKMHLTEVPDNGAEHVQTQLAMEFTRLVKLGKLPFYQRSIVDNDDGGKMEACMFSMGKFLRGCRRSLKGTFYQALLAIGVMKGRAADMLLEIKADQEKEAQILPERVRMKKVRDRADKVIAEWLKSAEGVKLRQKRGGRKEPSDDGISLASEELPRVFSRAQSAKNIMTSIRSEGGLSESDRRSLSLANMTAAGRPRDDFLPLVDEDTLSLDSFFPDAKAATRGDFDRRKRTLLERLFAVDRDVRKGRLMKHMNSERLATILEAQETGQHKVPSPTDGPRAIVIEGAALKHMLGDPELEEILFAVASNCDAVIACRVSPKQKALLVNLVRHNIVPEPVTLAIGDGANDVGMIQEAHVGVGISGKEGKQAVNASDFAIAQFRFLEQLILVHGRWDFFRSSVVVLFSFYKNAVMVGCIICYSGQTVFSGTPLFDEWAISVLNFVCGIPICMLGLYDRCLSKEYVLRNPETYNATRNNEPMSMRMRARWITICFVHIFTIYYLTVLPHDEGGGYTSAFQGMMKGKDTIGDGEGSDLKSVGVIGYTNIVLVLALKVLYECKSPIHGHWPAFTCSKDKGEGFFSRVAWTWQGVLWGSLLFYCFFISVYTALGWRGANSFSDFVGMGWHVFTTRAMSWLLVIFTPIVATMFDVIFKCFSNMFYPTQTQIHMEIECNEKADQRRYERDMARGRTSAGRPPHDGRRQSYDEIQSC